MIKAVKRLPGGGELVMLGLSEANVGALRLGRPILLDVDQCKMLGLGERQLLIYWGEDEVAMIAELEEHGLVPEGSAEQARREFAAHERRAADEG